MQAKIRISLFYFVIIALIGAFLRLIFVADPGILNFQYILHSHSHTAILGWVYNIIYLGVLFSFLPKAVNSKKFNLVFWLTQFSIIGMLITFSIQGYAAFSIAFSTLHILLSYFFIYFFIKDTRKNPSLSSLISIKFIYGAMFFLFLSTFGPWGLAVIIANGLSGSDMYKQAIYFYLHFQYDGWFIFALIGLWLWIIEKNLSERDKKNLTSAFYILFISNVPAYFLSLLGFKINFFLWLLALLSALGQLAGARFIYMALFASEKNMFSDVGSRGKILFRLSFLLLFIKYILQLISALPAVGEPAFVSREVTIGYIHLIMLGVISLGLLGWLKYNNLIILNSKGLIIFLFGFIASEILLFYPSFVIWFQAPAIPYYYLTLFVLTIFMLGGTVFIFFSNIKGSTQNFNS